jgi:hypothetical protein
MGHKRRMQTSHFVPGTRFVATIPSDSYFISSLVKETPRLQASREWK